MKQSAVFVSLVLFAIIVIRMLLFIEYPEFSDQVKGDGSLEITFLDIGQGDATFMTFPDGTQMLVDCAVDARILEALGRVMPFYDKTIDYVLITHPDKDHYGGCIDVFDRFDVGDVIYTGKEKDNVFYDSFVDAMSDEDEAYTRINSERMWTFGDAELHFLYPDHDVVGGGDDPNDTSIVLKIAYAGTSIIMTGDAEVSLEKHLIDRYADGLDADILRVGHHGASNASTQEFLDAVTPEHAVISAGIDNTYGHPTARTLKKLARVGATIWRTDLQGDILVTVSNHKEPVVYARQSD